MVVKANASLVTDVFAFILLVFQVQRLPALPLF